MNRMNDSESVQAQYADARNLNIRISLHAKYSVNKQGFGNWIREQYQFFDGCQILELGCGNGSIWDGHIDSIGTGSNLILSDFSEGMVKETEERFPNFPNVSFRRIDIQQIPYPNESFDFVIANMMLYHVPNLNQALTEVARVLKPNGFFYSATFGENGIQRYLMNTLQEYGYHQNRNHSFTLQNGKDILFKYFKHVVKREYPDALEITDTNDWIDYIYSMTSLCNITENDRKNLYALFEKQKDSRGVIRIPKEYGLFLSSKS